MVQSIDLIVKEHDGELQLNSPEVGHFTCSLAQGALLAPGQVVGVIRKLGQAIELTVPAGTSGRVTNARPDRINAPVGYGTRLYTLAPLSAEAAASSDAQAASAETGVPSFKSQHSGRFWHRPSPSDPAFAEVGSVISAGDPIGLIEVMKTFTHLTYDPSGNLPAKAKVTRILIGDGEEVSEGDVLIEVEQV